MLGPRTLSDDTLRPLVWKQTTPFYTEEIQNLFGSWTKDGPKYKSGVKIPVLYALGEYDWVWKGTKENIELFIQDFTSAPRIEASVVAGAPHALELGRGSEGWYTRVFGWAIEVAVGANEADKRPPRFE